MLSRIRVGDRVQVMSGKDLGKRGEVISLSKDRSRVKVRGVALRAKFARRAGSEASSGPIVEERFIYTCKVMPICPETDKPCRVRIKQLASGDKVRISSRSEVEL